MDPAVLGPGEQIMIHLSPAQGAVNENQIRQSRYLKKPSLTNGKEKRFFVED
jgi:hypothetical protein